MELGTERNTSNTWPEFSLQSVMIIEIQKIYYVLQEQEEETSTEKKKHKKKK